MILWSGIAFVVAVAFGALATRVTRCAASRVGLVDKPDGHRKLHARAIPLGGGFAVFVSTAGIVAAGAMFENPWSATLRRGASDLLGLLVASAIVLAVGLLDDFVRLRGRQKLVGQIVAAAALPACGLSIHSIQVLDWRLELGLLAVPFTIAWLVGAVNSVNLLDGIDGLATTLGVILSGGIAIMALLTGQPHVAIVAFVFAASLLGFLVFNFPPASMFLGDAGSMLIGLAVGTMAMQASLKGAGTVLLAAPLALWTIPIFDCGAAILRRKLTGRSVYSTDRGHLHHRFLNRFGSRRALAYVAAACLFTSAAALLSVFAQSDAIALLSAALLVLMFVTTRLFGHTEARLLLARFKGAARSLVAIGPRRLSDEWETTVRLQGTREWELLWATLAENAAKLRLQHISLDVNEPLLGEGYHASWTRRGRGVEQMWRLDLPLVVGTRSVGALRISGDRIARASENMQQVLEILEPFEARLELLTGNERPEHACRGLPGTDDREPRPRPALLPVAAK